MKTKLLLTLILVAGLANVSLATIVAYNFTGTVLVVAGKPWGFTVPLHASITGQFLYDTASAPSSTSAGVSIYPQNIPNGLAASFGSTTISASSYAVHIDNDFLSGNTLADIFSVQWSSNDSPSPSSPLQVNGTSQSTGICSVNLQYGPSTFSDTSLPSDLPTTGFSTSLTSYLSHNPLGAPDIIYGVNTLVPEPASWGIFSAGSIGIAMALFSVRHRGSIR